MWVVEERANWNYCNKSLLCRRDREYLNLSLLCLAAGLASGLASLVFF